MRFIWFSFGAFLLVAGTCWAQSSSSTPVPSKLDKALRTRAGEFLLNQTEGNFRKAFELVAEESKDYYLSSNKEQVSSPAITHIDYSDGFRKAVVTATVIRKANMGAAGVVDLPSTRMDSWELVHGKWRWFFDPALNCVVTLVGGLPCERRPAGGTAVVTSALPKSTTPAAVAEAAKGLVAPKSGISRQSIEFVKGQAGTEEISFHNGYPGSIRLTVGFTSIPAGFSVDNNGKMMGPNSDLIVKVSYVPEESSPDRLTLGFSVEPFGEMFSVPIRLVEAKVPATPAASAKP